jgi:hypothetical protein
LIGQNRERLFNNLNTIQLQVIEISLPGQYAGVFFEALFHPNPSCISGTSKAGTSGLLSGAIFK